jgi:Kef-type K+ transport system membrane component KefB
LSIIGICLSVIWVILDKGSQLVQENRLDEAINAQSTPLISHSSPTESIYGQFLQNVQHPLSILLMQLLVIFIVSRAFGAAMARIGIQTVIGEIIAGIFLGPSLVGWIFPEFSLFVFPKESLKMLQFLSQIGLAFFMFIIGMELDLSKIKNKAQDAVVISHASIVFPYLLGMALAYFIYPYYAPTGVSFLAFALFMGIAMSITAFPVLARILQERNLTQTPLGALAITCAAADDVTAWCILAAVVAIAKAGTIGSALVTIGLTVLFIFLMLKVVKPWIHAQCLESIQKGKIGKKVVTLFIFVLLFSAYFAEVIGIHALFGAFLAGVVMPSDLVFKKAIAEKIEDVSVLLLLPIFFAFTGLRTQISLLNEGHLWALCGVVVFIAVLGKWGGSAFAAKMVGHTWKDAMSIGALMNTRGLMELIVLNIGYDLGILSPEIFAIMVIMALATTFMTGPSLDLIQYYFRGERLEVIGESDKGEVV